MCSFFIKAFCTRVLVKKTTPKVDRIREFLVCDFFSKQVYRLRLHCIFWDISVVIGLSFLVVGASFHWVSVN